MGPPWPLVLTIHDGLEAHAGIAVSVFEFFFVVWLVP